MENAKEMTKKQAVTAMLSDIEKTKIVEFCKDETMLNAVEKILLFGLYNTGVIKASKVATPLRNGAFSLVSMQSELSNEVIGADLRAMWAGLSSLEEAITHMKSLVPGFTSETPKKTNKAI